MKSPARLFAAAVAALFAIFCLAPAPSSAQAAASKKVYELRTYHANPGKLDALLSRFRDHTVKLFEKHGMENVGYWVPVENEDNVLIYLMAYPSREAREASWKAFQEDPDWKAAYAESTKDGKLITKVDSLFLEATAYCPELEIKAQDPPRVFELRTYTTNEGKLENLDARFRDHTIELFGKHGMDNVLYLHPMVDQEGHGNTLVYLLAHKDQETRDASFKNFSQDPAWQSARDASEAEGKILIKGGVKSVMLAPVDFSPLK